MHLNGTRPLPKLSAHTNVWGIGAIMFELLTNEAVAHYLYNDEWTVNGVFTDIPNVRNPKYSGVLTELIRLCLMPDPWDRPSIEELELKVGARCQSITHEYAANPSLQQKDRLYYKGSEINQMPPGNMHYWNPVMSVVPHPSDPPDPNEIKNPFTDSIIYPPFPSSELYSSKEKRGEEQDGNGNDSPNEEDDKNNKVPKGPRGHSAGTPVVISDDPSSSPRGRDIRNPIIISDSGDREGGSPAEENNRSKGSNRSEHSRSSEEGSNNSDDSAARRRMAIKKLPGT